MVNSEELSYRLGMLDTIRNDKLSRIMPKVMKDYKCELFIHVLSRGNIDMYELDFGCDEGYFVYKLNEEDKYEMALFTDDFCKIPSAYLFSIIGKKEELRNYIKKHNPKVIAVNKSDKFCACDGLSVENYKKLCLLLGDEISSEIISSEYILSDFTTNRVASEISLFSKILEFQSEIEEEAFRTIIPGKTKLEDVSMYASNKLLEYGILPTSYLEVYAPGCLYSDADMSDWRNLDHTIREGDLLVWDNGYKYINFETDNKRTAYILRKGEYELPKVFERVWKGILEIREIIRKNVVCGDTAKNTLDKLVIEIEKNGFVYTPFEDNENDCNIVQAMGKSEKIGFSIDMHCVGNTGFSENVVGPSMAPFRHDRKDMIINDRNIISFEFHVHYWNEEKGERLAMLSEENAIITTNGVELLGEAIDEILLL